MYTNTQVAQILGIEGMTFENERPLTILLTDSRSLTFPEETLFFALVGVRDGHEFIPSLYNQGVRYFVVSHYLPSFDALTGATFFFVKDTLKALQRLAGHHRQEFMYPVIGITGSNGKTIVKDWLYQLMRDDRRIVRSPRSYNSQIGVPLSLWMMKQTDELAIIEVGISKPGEMQCLQPIVSPTIGIFTNLGVAHDEGFETMQQKCMEKMELFRHTDVLIYDADNELVRNCVQNAFFGSQIIGWSRRDKDSPLYIIRVEKAATHTTIHYSYIGICGSFTIPFIEEASVENSIHCLAVLLYWAYSPEEVAERMAQLKSVEMRLEVKAGVNNLLVINDSYNNDYNSLLIALDFLKRRSEGDKRRRTLILSDMYEYNSLPSSFYKMIGKVIASQPIDRLITIGPDLITHKEYFKSLSPIQYYTTASFLSSVEYRRLADEIILLKGSNSFNFEQISDGLQMKLHETTLEVDLSAIASNLRLYKALLRPETKMVAMVKAFGYGAGSYELSRTLQELGCDFLAVAVADEGVELRNAGIVMPIMVMNPEIMSLPLLFRYNLEPEVFSIRMFNHILDSAQQHGVTNFPIHIKVDTGMRRLGFLPSEMEQLTELINHQTALKVRSVFSHLVGSDAEEFDAITRQQIADFTAAARQLEDGIGYRPYRHILNTAGIERFPDSQFEMVRLGIGLYGYSPVQQAGIVPVGRLSTTILQIKEVSPLDRVGYSRRGHLPAGGRIATLPIGYADGLNRHLGNGVGGFWIRDYYAPIVGSVCMDLTMVDVTHIPNIVEGEKAILFSPEHLASELSDKLHTIPYEIISAISSRVKRVYYKD